MFVVTANIFQPLIDVFEAVLKFFHNHVGISWGFSIVLLTVVMRAILVPLTVKQFHSMQKMQRMQPQMKAIQAKYKDDKQRQQQEMMKFYKENEINPLGSCLPLVAQIPVFISLFYMLRQDLRKNICPDTQAAYQVKYAAAHHITLAQAAGHTTPCGPNNGAGFLFIPDLTDKATGVVLVVLLLLYVGSQLASSLMMSSPMMDKHPAAADAAAAAVLRGHRDQLPGRPARLLDHHEPVDDGPAVHREENDRASHAARRRPGADGTVGVAVLRGRWSRRLGRRRAARQRRPERVRRWRPGRADARPAEAASPSRRRSAPGSGPEKAGGPATPAPARRRSAPGAGGRR